MSNSRYDVISIYMPDPLCKWPRSRRSFLALGCALSSSFCGGKAGKLRVGIAAQQSISQVPVYLASFLGIFAKHGLQVELAEFAGASKGMEAMLGGSIDVLSGYYTQALQVTGQGKPVAAFLGIHDSLLVALAASPAGRRVTRIAELRGGKAGVTTLGSATHQFLDFLLRSNGLTPSDVTPIAIGTAARAAAAMERGIVDAGVVTDFTIRYLRKRFGDVTLLADTRARESVRAVHGVDAFPGTVLMASTEWLRKNSQHARQAAAAVREAMDWMKARTAEEIASSMPAAHYGEDREAYVAANQSALPLLSRDGNISRESHRAAARFLALSEDTPTAFVRIGESQK